MTDIDCVVRAWTRLGAAFAVEPLDELPDLERLLIATCRAIPSRPRLMQMAATWLGEYGRWVARSRFRHLVRTELPDEDVATLGLLLEEAESRLRDHPFREIIHDPEAGVSAMELLRRCGGKSYPPVLKALGQLERSGTIDRLVEGTSKRIRLVGAFRLVPVLPVAG